MKQCDICGRFVPRLYNMVNTETGKEALLCPKCHNLWKKQKAREVVR